MISSYFTRQPLSTLDVFDLEKIELAIQDEILALDTMIDAHDFETEEEADYADACFAMLANDMTALQLEMLNRWPL